MRGERDASMKRNKLNPVVDLLAGVLLLGMIATGFILWFPLPPGTGTTYYLWGLTRYSWGAVHAWISVLLLSVLLVHVVLHWTWMLTVISRRVTGSAASPKQSRQIGILTIVVLCVCGLLLGWITLRSVKPIPDSQVLESKRDHTADASREATGSDRVPVSFGDDVEPILRRSCLACHGAKRAAGGFRVDRKDDFFSSPHGRPFIVPGDVSMSPLIAIVSGTRKAMPLPNRHKLPDGEVQLLRDWIDQGAPWPERPDR